jgi:hypothetical protein
MMSWPLSIGLIGLLLIPGCSRVKQKYTVNNGEVFYRDGVTETEAKQVGEFLVQERYFDGGRKSVELAKNGTSYQFRVVVAPAYRNDPRALEEFRITAGRIGREVLNGAHVEVQICDDQLKTLATGEPIDIGALRVFNNGQVFFNEQVAPEEADKLGKFLIKEKFFDGTRKSVQVLKFGKKYQFRMVVKPEFRKDSRFKWEIQFVGGKMRREVFNGAEIEVHLCDEQLNTLAAFETLDFGPMLTFNNGQLFFKDEITKDEAEKLGEFLIKEQFFDGIQKTIQVVRDGKKYLIRIVVAPGSEQVAQFRTLVQTLGGRIRHEVFPGAELALQLCDPQFQTLTTLDPIEPKTAPETK